MPPMQLSPDRSSAWPPPCARAPQSGHVLVDAPNGTTVDIGPDGFAILALFARPRALGDAIERLEDEWGTWTRFAPTMGALNILIEEDALVRFDAAPRPTSGWADPINTRACCTTSGGPGTS